MRHVGTLDLPLHLFAFSAFKSFCLLNVFFLYIMVFQFDHVDFNQVHQKKFATTKRSFFDDKCACIFQKLKESCICSFSKDDFWAMFRPRNKALFLFLLIIACQNVIFII